MIHFTFIICLNRRLSSADIKIICWLNKDKGNIGSYIFQERHCQPRADLCFPPVVRYESNLNAQK